LAECAKASRPHDRRST